MNSKRRLTMLLVGLSLLVALVLAACGGEEASDTTGDEVAGETSAEDGSVDGGEGDDEGTEAESVPIDVTEPVFRTDTELIAEFGEPPTGDNWMIDQQGKTYTATIVTDRGDIHLNLFADKAPFTVNNFVYLSCNGYYDLTTFHRVLPAFMAQGGDPTGTGSGGPGYSFEDEFGEGLVHDAGTLSMANSGPATNGSQFFITTVPTPHLDGLHAIFGEVADEQSFEIVESLTVRDPSTLPDPLAFPGDTVITIEIQEDGAAFCQ